MRKASVDRTGDVKVTLGATGKKRKKLSWNGKVALSFVSTFTPNGGSEGGSSEYLTLRKKPE